MKYRLYIDEVGHSDIGKSVKPENKYLSLTSVALELDCVDKVLFPQVEGLKRRYFSYYVDDPIVLHRKEIVNKKPPFDVLRDRKTEIKFNDELLTLLEDWDYTVFSVLIDKKEHQEKYKVWQFEPYHYCLQVLLERYILWLEENEGVGDVLAESRGGKQDMRLKKSFNNLFNTGTDYISSMRFKFKLTSCQLKIKPKSNNISGLQLADILAHPSYKYILAFKARRAMEDNFGKKIVDILTKNKYYRRKSNNQIQGYGIKHLP